MSGIERGVLYVVLFLFGLSLGILTYSYHLGRLEGEISKLEKEVVNLKIEKEIKRRGEVRKDESNKGAGVKKSVERTPKRESGAREEKGGN